MRPRAGRRGRRFAGAIIAIAALVSISCAPLSESGEPPPPPVQLPPPPPPPPLPPPPSEAAPPAANGLQTAWSLLTPGESEPRGPTLRFGMYSYLVFRAPPTAASRPRYIAAINAIKGYGRLDATLRYFPRRSINVTYIPVRGRRDEATAEAILDDYDYDRARAILSQVEGVVARGPLIVSSTAPLDPLDAAGDDERVLWQDLSAVPPVLVRLWIEEYMSRSVSQDGFEGEAGARWAVQLRTGIEQAAEAWPIVSDSIESLVGWARRIRGRA